MGMTVAEIKYYEPMKELGCCTDDPEQQKTRTWAHGCWIKCKNYQHMRIESFELP